MREKRHWDLLNTTFLVGTLLAAAILVPLNFRHSLERWGQWVVFGGMLLSVGLGVTAGYHRLFSHRAYQAAWPVRFVLLLLGAAAFQNSVLQWASSHRIHHRHVDGERDPYNSTRGFWYSHWLWVMEADATPIQGVADLEKDPLVMWQHRNIFKIGAVVAVVPPLAAGLLLGDVWGHLVTGLLLRIVVTHHTTFFINSAAHFFGTRPYTDANTARDNALLAPLTYGEGYHNYHHLFQWDYRNGVRWWQFDPTKWLIFALACLGLARNLRRVPDAAIRRARLAMEEKRILARLARRAHAHPAKEELDRRLVAARARLDEALARMQAQVEAWEARKSERRAHQREAWKVRKAEWKAAMAQHRKEVAEAWDAWKAAKLQVRRLALT